MIGFSSDTSEILGFIGWFINIYYIDVIILFEHDTVAPRYNALVGVHDIGPRCKRGALGFPVSATRGTTNSN